jgi:O-succinylbenzoic acid--CoA ligase
METIGLNWDDDKNILLLNPRWPKDVLKYFNSQFKLWNENHSEKGLIFIPTSGTTAKDLTDTKVVVLTKRAVLASAHSVGQYFEFKKGDRVVQSLPVFHVGGLSQMARAHLWRQILFENSEKWDAQKFYRFLFENKITHASLVPTQLYDLVSAKIKAPPSMKCLFLGGGIMGGSLRKAAQDLGWNPIMTYGSTETSSMVGVKKNEGYQALPHAQFRVSEKGFLEIKSASLMSGYWNCKTNSLIEQAEDSWFTTQDLARKVGDEFEILGRGSDYAKISGEGVYLTRLQNILQDCFLEVLPKLAADAVIGFLPSERRGQEVHMFSTRPQSELEGVLSCYNEKVLPFERIQGFHQVKEIPRTELGKVRWQELK